MKNLKNLNFLIIFFLIFIYIPLFGLVFNIQDGLENTEKRNMAEFPKFKTAEQFTDGILKYFEDNFGFRYSFMRFATNLKMKLFKTYPRSVDIKVLRGKEGWLFYKLGNETEDFEGRVPFTKEKIEKIIKNNKLRAEKLRPAKFYILIPPDKTVVYSEFLPDIILQKENIQNSRITSLLAANTKSTKSAKESTASSLNIIYPKNILIQNKEKGPIYYTTDTHWTYLGAYFGYVELINTIQKDFKDIALKPLDIKDFKKEEYIYDRPDLLNMVNIGAKNTEKSFKYICPLDENRSNLRVLAFGDSFYEHLDPYLRCTFKYVKYINSNTIDFNAVKDFKPDVVIFEIVQRNIRQLEISDK